MLNFDERDLVDLAERAGFFPIHLRLETEITPLEQRSWGGFLNQAGNPRIPTIAEAMHEALTPDEQNQLAAHSARWSRKDVVRGEWLPPISTQRSPEAGVH